MCHKRNKLMGMGWFIFLVTAIDFIHAENQTIPEEYNDDQKTSSTNELPSFSNLFGSALNTEEANPASLDLFGSELNTEEANPASLVGFGSALTTGETSNPISFPKEEDKNETDIETRDYGHHGGYGHEKCYTTYKTVYKTVYETSYKKKCHTSYDKKCHTEYYTSYKKKCSTSYSKKCHTSYKTVYKKKCKTHYEHKVSNIIVTI